MYEHALSNVPQPVCDDVSGLQGTYDGNHELNLWI